MCNIYIYIYIYTHTYRGSGRSAYGAAGPLDRLHEEFTGLAETSLSEELFSLVVVVVVNIVCMYISLSLYIYIYTCYDIQYLLLLLLLMKIIPLEARRSGRTINMCYNYTT